MAERESKETTELSTRIDVQTLVVNPRQKREIAIGDTESFTRVAKDTVGLSAILWNENCIVLITKDPSTIISFKPEINPSVAMFFARGEKRMGGNAWTGDIGIKVWEGDFEPVRFTKSSLLKFLKQYTLTENTKLIEAVKEMKITERHVRTEHMIELDEQNFQATEEQVMQTNIPTKFSLEVPLIQGSVEKVYVSLDFEAEVVTNEERYGEAKGKKLIQIRCLNGRQVLHNLMKGYSEMLPKTIPRYYGRLSIEAMRE